MQSAKARTVSNAAAAAHRTGSRPSAVPASGAKPSSNVALITSIGSSTQDSSLLHSYTAPAAHSTGEIGQPDNVAAEQSSVNLVALLTPADSSIGLDTANVFTTGLSAVDASANEHRKAQKSASGQQMAHANGQQKGGHTVEGQPKAKVVAASEGQLESSHSLAQRSKANPMLDAEVHGQSKTINMEPKAEMGSSAKAIHSIGKLVSTYSTAICSLGLKSS